MKRDGFLLPALAVYAAASLFHHAHNVEFLDRYPNMPTWLSPAVVYAAWASATAIGVLGYWLRRRALLVAYGCYGLGVLAHYALAPVSAHTPMMHLSIALEATTALGVLLAVARMASPARIRA